VNENLQTAVVFYGQLRSTDPAVFKGLEEPVLGIFGADAQSIPVSTVRAFESTLKGM